MFFTEVLGKNSWKNNRGSTLVIVLWTVAILSLLAMGAGFQVWVEAKLTAFQFDRVKEKRLLLASVELAKSILEKDSDPVDSLKELWSNNPDLFKNVQLSEGQWSLHRVVASDSGETADFFGLEDEEGKINLNKASQKMIESLPGIEKETAASIVDWRDEDSNVAPGGAEDLYYQSLNHPYHCKNGPLESVEELLLIRGVTPPLYKKIRPWVTVYGNGKVNINSAPGKVLESLGLDSALVVKIVRYRQGGDGKEGTEDDGLFTKTNDIVKQLNDSFSITAEETSQLQRLLLQGFLSVGSSHFRMVVEITPENRKAVSKFEVVLESNSEKKDWKVKQCSRLY